MRVCRGGVIALCLATLLVLSMACCTALSISDVVEMEENELPATLIKKGSDKEVYWKGEASYPYKLTIHEWKESYEVEGEYKPVIASFMVEYPSISGMKDPKLEQQINQMIYDKIEKIVGKHFPVSEGLLYDTFLWRKCFIMLLTKDYLSIRFDGGTTYMRSNRFSEVMNII